MLKFLFGAKGKVRTVKETQRNVVERALGEVNAIVALMDEKPKVTFDPATGAISFDLPEQMPDEALALPAPEKDAVSSEAKEEAA
jgi:hypothetical protein